MCSKRVFEPVKRLIVGAILVPGKRTVTSMRRVMRHRDDQHFQHDHRVLSWARWSALCGGRILLRWLWRAFVPTGPVVIGIDETISMPRSSIPCAGVFSANSSDIPRLCGFLQ
jgi:hypothetical protein